jgi:hypothetical protein
MRWLRGRMASLLLTGTLAAGCGSTGGDDALVFHFIRFDNTGITQADSVRETSADVDIFQDMCQSGTSQSTPEPFTVTTVNAVFRNEEAADLHLQRVVIDVGPKLGRAPITHQLDGDIPGGRCSNIDQQCSADGDCLSGSTGTVGSCLHTETTIGAVVLFDFEDKLHLLPGTDSVTITFSASDSIHTFQTSTSYVVTFDDFDNCSKTGG